MTPARWPGTMDPSVSSGAMLAVLGFHVTWPDFWGLTSNYYTPTFWRYCLVASVSSSMCEGLWLNDIFDFIGTSPLTYQSMNERLGILEEWFTLAGHTLFLQKKNPITNSSLLWRIFKLKWNLSVLLLSKVFIALTTVDVANRFC